MKNVRNNYTLKELNQLNEIKLFPDFKDPMNSQAVDNSLQITNSDNHIPKPAEEEGISDAPFLLTVEIDKDESRKLKIYHDSIPEEVAFNFCKKYNLDFMANDYLVKEIKKILENDKKNAPQFENEMNINFSETIHEVDEEYINSELHRKDSEKVKANLFHNNIVGDKKEILLVDGKHFRTETTKENGSSKPNYSPFITETSSSHGENGLLSLIRKNKGREMTKSTEFRNKKSKSAKSMILTTKIAHSNRAKSEKKLKNDFELRCERVKRLRDIKSYFSQTFNAQFLIPPPIYDFSILKVFTFS
jgi:hypothetical protein